MKSGEKDCIWSLAYDRLKAYGEEEEMLDRPVVYRNGDLKGTSAWGNTYLGKDHHAKTDGDSASTASSTEHEVKENK